MQLTLSKNQQNTIFLIFIVVNLVLFSIVIYYLYSYKEEYTSNPLSYGVKKMNLGQCTLTCFSDGNYEPSTFFVNSTSFSQHLKGGLLNIDYNGTTRYTEFGNG